LGRAYSTDCEKFCIPGLSIANRDPEIHDQRLGRAEMTLRPAMPCRHRYGGAGFEAFDKCRMRLFGPPLSLPRVCHLLAHIF
jgi:hypothetical protein